MISYLAAGATVLGECLHIVSDCWLWESQFLPNYFITLQYTTQILSNTFWPFPIKLTTLCCWSISSGQMALSFAQMCHWNFSIWNIFVLVLKYFLTLLATVDDWRRVADHVHWETIVVAVKPIETLPETIQRFIFYFIQISN